MPLSLRCVPSLALCIVVNVCLARALKMGSSDPGRGVLRNLHLQKKVCFVQVPKTASESVCSALGLLKDHRPAGDREDFESGCWKFSIVRNPWDRMRSWYTFCNAGNHGVYNYTPRPLHACRLTREMDMNLWIEKVLGGTIGVEKWVGKKIWPIGSAKIWIADEQGNDLVDFVGRYEDLSETMLEVSKHAGMNLTLPHFNDSPATEVQEIEFSPAADELIRKTFAYEIDRFGYKNEFAKK